MNKFAMAVGVFHIFLTAAFGSASAESPQERPNILWLTCEDTGPHLGCYGDAYSTTPSLDAVAARGTIYTNCWSNAPVCAPARTTLISGMYPTCTGAEHMRSTTALPVGMKMYPQYLREAGYYCTNNNKEDYNLEKPGKVWDESSGKAHWKNRSAGQPFFAVFNFVVTHESQVRARPHTPVHDPAKVRVPAYHPDTPEVRRDWAQYYDKITEMDELAGQRLDELRAAGLEDDTIVFFYGDHGPGMPRCKRWPYDSGLHAPLLIYVPPKFASVRPGKFTPGGRCDRLVAFVDFAPTLLSLCGIEPPKHMQGRAFLGKYAQPESEYLFGFRGRMDERYDLVRSVRDKRYVYLRQYMPHRIYGQHISYMFETPTTRVWKRLFDEGEKRGQESFAGNRSSGCFAQMTPDPFVLSDEGKLTPEQSRFWQRKPPEELYDLENDPDEVHNLADSPEHRAVLQRMRGALKEWVLQVRDVGFLPECEIHSRSAGSTPYEMGHDPSKYPLERILAAADAASDLSPLQTPQLVEWLKDSDSAVRYWAALGLLMRGEDAVTGASAQLERMLDDPAPCVRIAAAEALAQFMPVENGSKFLRVLIDSADAGRNGAYVALLALNAIDALGKRAASLHGRVPLLEADDPGAPKRMDGYVGRLIETIDDGRTRRGSITK
jgi:uncharacterized sulfatase